jgi:predicted nucleic acid-binding protein
MSKTSKRNIKRIYIDACILIAIFSSHKEEREKKKLVLKCFNLLKDFQNLQLFTSSWAIAEMLNVFICRHKMRPGKVREIEEQIMHTERIHNLKIYLIDASPLPNYSVREFLYHVHKAILSYHPGLGDAMHWVIMKNNQIKKILTLDTKGFAMMPGLEVIEPIKIIEASQD